MTGINTGILTNAHPLTAEQIKALEKKVLETGDAFAYLDENGRLCFAVPHGIDGLRELAWHQAHELVTNDGVHAKKVYKKHAHKEYSLHEIFQKEHIDAAWVSTNAASLLDEGLLDEFILA